MKFDCDFGVKVTPAQASILLGIVKKLGYTLCSSQIQVDHYIQFWVDKNLTHSEYDYTDTNYGTVSFEVALNYFVNGVKFWKESLSVKPFWKVKKTLTFGQHTAEIMPGEYIKIGCTTLNDNKVKEIITAWNAGKIEKRWIKVCSKKESTLVQLACFREGIQWVRHYANQLFFCDDMTGTYYLCPFINGDKKELIWSDKEYQSLTFQEGMVCLLTGTLFNEVHYIDIPNLQPIKVNSGVSIEHPIEGFFPAELINKLIEIYQS